MLMGNRSYAGRRQHPATGPFPSGSLPNPAPGALVRARRGVHMAKGARRPFFGMAQGARPRRSRGESDAAGLRRFPSLASRQVIMAPIVVRQRAHLPDTQGSGSRSRVRVMLADPADRKSTRLNSSHLGI